MLSVWETLLSSHCDTVPEQSALTIAFALWEHLFIYWLMADSSLETVNAIADGVCVSAYIRVQNWGARAKVYTFTLIWCAL